MYLSGSSDEDVGRFFDWFDIFSVSKGYTPERKVAHLPLFLKGNALETYFSLSDAQKGNYELAIADYDQAIRQGQQNELPLCSR